MPFVVETKQRTKPLVPSFTWKPVDLLVGYNGSVRVDWRPAIDSDGMSGSNFFVNYRIDGSKLWCTTSPVTDKDYTVVHLNPDETYQMIVVSVDHIYETESAIQYVSKDLYGMYYYLK